MEREDNNPGLGPGMHEESENESSDEKLDPGPNLGAPLPAVGEGLHGEQLESARLTPVPPIPTEQPPIRDLRPLAESMLPLTVPIPKAEDGAK